jgi:hypothetical protein
MNDRLAAPAAKSMSIDLDAASVNHATGARLSKADADTVRRRDIAAVLGGALGAFALSACANEAIGASRERLGQLADALSGTDIAWVNTVIGSPPGTLPANRTGDLATRYGGTGGLGATVAIARGSWKDNDGGGGTFIWVTTGSANLPADDGGVAIVPINQPPNPAANAGYWQRVYGQPVNVKWFGAQGDGSSTTWSSGPYQGQTYDQVAIQNAINVASTLPSDVRGNDVLIPPGRYVLSAPSGGAALWIDQNNVNLIGVGGPPNGSQFLLTGSGTGIVIESSASNSNVGRGAQIRNLSIYGSHAAKDGIVIHAVSVTIYDCFITSMTRHGIVIEAANAPLVGATRAPTGSSWLADAWRLTNIYITLCGDSSSNGNETAGSAVYVRTNNANGGIANGLFADVCNVGFFDSGLANTWLACYSQAGQIGFKAYGAANPTYVGCNSEDVISGSFSNGITVGGTVCQIGPAGAQQRVGYGISQLQFRAVGGDGATYGANVPGVYTAASSAIDIIRGYATWVPRKIYAIGDTVIPPSANGFYYKCTTGGTSGTTAPTFPTNLNGTVTDGATGLVWTCSGTTKGNSQWVFAYRPFSGLYDTSPFVQQGWRWFHLLNGIVDSNLSDPYAGPFGWTDVDNPRGGGLPFIGNPLINSQRRWTWRQDQDITGVPIKLRTNDNVIYLGGTSSDGQHGGDKDHGGFTFADPPQGIWPNAQARVCVDIAFPDDTTLRAADLRIVGYALYTASNGHRNIAVKIFNAGGSEVTVALLWHYETFVTNLDPPGGLA